MQLKLFETEEEKYYRELYRQVYNNPNEAMTPLRCVYIEGKSLWELLPQHIRADLCQIAGDVLIGR